MILIPSVSIGNVPQLALDLLIHNYNFELVASLDDEFLCPFIGPVDHLPSLPQQDGIATAAQLFRSGPHYLVQLRSPTLSGSKTRFVKSLLSELADLKLLSDNDIIAVGSANAGMSEHRNQTNYIETIKASEIPILPESGFVKEILSEAPGNEAIVAWVHEGDNILDGENLANALIDKLGFSKVEMKHPISWSRVYGKDAPLGVENGLYT